VRFNLSLGLLCSNVGEFLRSGLVELELLGNRRELVGRGLVEFDTLGICSS
jgi:hypothetical protein